jgi:hypothetical protein
MAVTAALVASVAPGASARSLVESAVLADREATPELPVGLVPPAEPPVKVV